MNIKLSNKENIKLTTPDDVYNVHISKDVGRSQIGDEVFYPDSIS